MISPHELDSSLSGVTASQNRFHVMTGSKQEIGRQLTHRPEAQWVAIELDAGLSPQAAVIADTVSQIAQLIQHNFARHQRETLETLVEALVPKAPPTPHQLKEVAMLARARTQVLQQDHWLTAAQIAELAGFSASNPSAQPNKWKREGQIFAIRHHGIDYFPSYGLDPASFRPLKAMARLLKIFAGAKDAWGLAYWFESLNGFLGGKRPLELLAKAPDQVMAAAVDELDAIEHG